MNAPNPTSAVADVIQGYPVRARKVVLAVRRLIFDIAAEFEEVGQLTETLKWGEPAYLTEQSKSGSTIRIGWRSSHPDECALYFICSTSLISDFRTMFEGVLRFEGNRAVLLSLSEPLPTGPLNVCIAAALRYHIRASRSSG